MSNMSYCMFENTLRDLRQVQADGDFESNDLNETEIYARKELVKLCREIAENFQNYT